MSARKIILGIDTSNYTTSAALMYDDGELIAVITAAIAAYRASEEGLTGDDVNGFRVVSFKRATKGRAWNSNK